MSKDVQQAWREFCAARGEEAAFEPFYAATVRPAWSICRRILRHDDDAQDALQMAYARLLAIARDPEAARAVDDAGALVRRLAVREATNLRKRRGRRSQKEAAVEHISAFPDEGRSPSEEAARHELRGRLEALISLLPEHYRVPLLLHYFEGLTHEEIAQALGQKRTTITVRLQRGIRKLEPMARRAGLGSVPAALGALAGGGAGAGLLDPPAALSAAAVLDAASGLAAGMSGAAALAAATGGGAGAGLTGSLFASGGAIVNTKLAMAGVAAAIVLVAGVAIYVNQTKPSTPSSESSSSISAIAAQTSDDAFSVESASPKSTTDGEDATREDQLDAGGISPDDSSATATLAAATQDDAETEPAGHGRITGRVVLDATGKPIAGASVAWLNKSGRGGDELPDKTGADGAFEIPNLPPGTYYVMAKKDALRSEPSREQAREITLEHDGEAVGPVELRLREGRALRVRVTDAATGQPIAGAEAKLNNGTIQITNEQGETVFVGQDAAERRVEATAPGFAKQNKTANLTVAAETLLEIALQPGGSLIGVVSDEAGQPVADVEIRDAYSGPVSFGWKTKSAADGAYRLDNLPLRTKIFGIIYEKDGYVGYWASDIELTDPATPMEYNVTLTRGLSLVGIVTDNENKPIAEAVVQYGMQSNPSFRETKSGADGCFRLDTLSDKDFAKQLYVQAKGFSPVKMKVEPGSPDAPPDITIVLTKGHWIKGRVVDEEGQPRQGVYISPLGFDHHYLAGGRFITKADGKFEYDSLPPDARFDFYGDAISEQRNVELTLDRDDVVVTILGEGWIVGRVEDEETEEPVTKFNIKIGNTRGCPHGSGFASIEVSRMNRGADFTSDKGLFELRDLQIGPAYMLTVEAEGYPPTAFDCQLARAKEKAELVTLKMKRGGEILRGIVQDKDGEPIAGAEVSALVYKNPKRDEIWFQWDYYKQNREMFLYYRVTETDDEGRFEFTEVSSGQPIDILATADSYPRMRVDRLEERSREERENLVITLSPAARVFGRVDRAVYPEAAKIMIQSKADQSYHIIQDLKNDFTFEFAGQNPGDYTLGLQSTPEQMKDEANGNLYNSSHYAFTHEIRLEEGADFEINFPRGGTAAVRGRALQGGQPVANSRVALKAEFAGSYSTHRMAPTDAEGRFEFPAVEPSQYSLLIWGTQPLTFWEQRTRPATELFQAGVADIERDFDFEITGTVRGRLTGPPKAECRLTLRPHVSNSETQIHPQAKPGADGAFVFNDVKAGEYSLMVRYTSSAEPPTGHYRQLLSAVAVTAEHRDVDLGDVPMPLGGQLRVQTSGATLDDQQPITILIFTAGAETDGTLTMNEALLTSYLSASAPTVVLDDLPAGRLLVCATGAGHRSEPRVVPVEVVAGETADATVAFVPITALTFWAQPEAQFQSATLRRADGLQEFSAEATDNSEDENLLNVEPVLRLNSRYGYASHIEPGEWTLTITDTQGRTATQTFDVQLGHPIRQQMATIK